MTTTLPSGVVTFLFTDIEGSTRRWEADPEAMRAALATHDEVLRSAIEARGGFLSAHRGRDVRGVHLTEGGGGGSGRRPACIGLPVRMEFRPGRPSCAAVTTSVLCSIGRRG